MEHCPKCNQKLNVDEKAAGRCFSCGASFDGNVPKDTKQRDSVFTFITVNEKTLKNAVALLIKIVGSAIFILGSIFSINLGIDDESFMTFLESEFIFVVIGVLFDGFAEIIALLEEIKNRL